MPTAILTKYIGPTNTRGTRIKAWAPLAAHGPQPYVILSWDYGLSCDANHDAAARELARQLNWPGAYVRGDIATGSVYVRAAAAVRAFVVEPGDKLPMSRTVARGH